MSKHQHLILHSNILFQVSKEPISHKAINHHFLCNSHRIHLLFNLILFTSHYLWYHKCVCLLIKMSEVQMDPLIRLIQQKLLIPNCDKMMKTTIAELRCLWNNSKIYIYYFLVTSLCSIIYISCHYHLKQIAILC